MATFTFGSSKLIVASTTETVVSTRLRSYKLARGEYELAFKNLETTELNCALMFAMQDQDNGYMVNIEDNYNGMNRVSLYAIVAGVRTQLGISGSLTGIFTRGNKTWLRVHYDRIQGTINVWVRDNAGAYTATPQITAYVSTWSYGYVGVMFNTTGMGAVNVEVSDFNTRAQSRIGDTNITLIASPSIWYSIGVKWDSSLASPTLTQLVEEGIVPNCSREIFSRNAIFAGIRRCNLSDAGVVTAYFGDTAFKYDGSNGQVMVEIRKFWYKTTRSGTINTYNVSPVARTGYSVHPAFITDGRELDAIYIGAFEACAYDVSAAAYNTTDAAGVDFTATTGDKLASIAGVKPISGKNNAGATLPAFRQIAKNRGAGWGLQTFQQVSALELLYAIEYANWNSQSVLSAGVTNITDDSTTNMAVNTGFTAGVGTGASDLGNASGQVSISHYQTSQTTYPMSYRGVENLYGNLWKWVDGLNIKGDNMPWVADHDFASDVFAHPYVDTGLTLPAANGYGSNLAYAAGFDWAFLPSAAAGSSTTYLCDYYYQNTGNKSALFGGNWLHGAAAGTFHWALYAAASSVYRSIGARVAFTPQTSLTLDPVPVPYKKPMLRGVQRGEYWNGTTLVPCVRYADDFNWDTANEYSTINGVVVHDAADGSLYAVATDTLYRLNCGSFGSGVYQWTCKIVSVDGSYTFKPVFGWNGTKTGTVLTNGYLIQLIANSTTLRVYRYDAGVNVATVITTTAPWTTASGDIVTILCEWNASTGLITVTWTNITQNLSITASGTDTTYTSGYAGVAFGSMTSAMKCTNLAVNALHTPSTNGTALSMCGVAHGGLYDTEQWMGLKWAKEAYAYARDYACAVKMGLSTAATAYTLWFKDYTKNLAIQASGSIKQYDTTSGNAYTTYNVPTIELTNTNDGDQILIGFDRTTVTGEQPPVYITEINLTKQATPNATYESPVSEIATVASESATGSESVSQVLEKAVSESVNGAETPTQELHSTTNETATLSEGVGSELDQDVNEQLQYAESNATVLEDTANESMSAVESLESVYEMSIDEIVSLIEAANIVYNHYTVYVELVCNFGYNTSTYLAAPQIVTSPVYQHDVGVRIRVYTNNTVIPDSTVLTLIIKRPYGAAPLEVHPQVDFTTGVLTYDSVAGDLRVHGKYTVQVHGVFVDGDDLLSDAASFIVYPR